MEDGGGSEKIPFNMKITRCRFLRHFGINAIVLYPFVLYCDSKPSRRIVSHEEVHLDQIKREGAIRFYRRYLVEYLQGRMKGLSHDEAYRDISYEKEAYLKEFQELT